MLKTVLKALDQWISAENKERTKGGSPLLHSAEIKIVGQSALLEYRLDLHLVATSDVDAFLKADYSVQKRFDELLSEQGRHWDRHSDEVWMPSETEYEDLFSGKWIKGFLAKPEYILVSKALKAPQKNRALITEYLAKEPSSLFFELAEKYKVDLDQFL